MARDLRNAECFPLFLAFFNATLLKLQLNARLRSQIPSLFMVFLALGHASLT